MVVAKTDPMHYALAAQFEARTTEKEYFAITAGVPDRDRDLIAQPIGVHPQQREKMAIRAGHSTSREATTFYEVIERFAGFGGSEGPAENRPDTSDSRHLAHIGCPVLCDKLYAGHAKITRGELRRRMTTDRVRNAADDDEVILARQALHARRIKLAHPATGQPIEFIAPLPADIVAVLNQLRSATV